MRPEAAEFSACGRQRRRLAFIPALSSRRSVHSGGVGDLGGLGLRRLGSRLVKFCRECVLRFLPNPRDLSLGGGLGLADRFIAAELRGQVVEKLQAESWSGDGDLNAIANASTSRVLRELEAESESYFEGDFEGDSPVQTHYAFIQRVTDQGSVNEIVEALLAEESEDKWISRAQKAITHGSPLAIHLIARQLHVTRHMSLKEVFESELVLSVQSGKHREFPEGVRALLVDKDGAPQWTFSTLAEVDESVVDEFFESPWEVNPLADM